MQIKTFILPVSSENGELEDFNRFLRSVRILEVKKELVKVDCSIFWAVCVSYITIHQSGSPVSSQFGKGKIDYKDILSEEDFERFCNLRKIRKRLADDAAIPAFAVFTDAELVEISKIDKLTLSALKNIKGIGEKRIEKFGIQICGCAEEGDLKKNETNRESF